MPSTESSPHCASLKETLTTATKEFRSLLSSLSFEQASEHLVQYGHDQVTFGAGSAPAEVVEDTAADVDHDALDRISQTVKELHRTAQAMCPLSTIAKSALTETIHALSSHASSGAAPALLAFIALVTPSSNLASELHANPAEYLSKITSEFEHSLLPGGIEKPVEILRGVPEAISPVKATMGYIQGEAGLQQVWRFEVEMKDNWYEGTVDFKTGRVVGAVDWARDAPSPKKGKKTGASQSRLRASTLPTLADSACLYLFQPPLRPTTFGPSASTTLSLASDRSSRLRLTRSRPRTDGTRTPARPTRSRPPLPE